MDFRAVAGREPESIEEKRLFRKATLALGYRIFAAQRWGDLGDGDADFGGFEEATDAPTPTEALPPANLTGRSGAAQADEMVLLAQRRLPLRATPGHRLGRRRLPRRHVAVARVRARHRRLLARPPGRRSQRGRYAARRALLVRLPLHPVRGLL